MTLPVNFPTSIGRFYKDPFKLKNSLRQIVDYLDFLL